jgi:threonine dehydratase
MTTPSIVDNPSKRLQESTAEDYRILARILNARVRDIMQPTSLDHATLLSAKVGHQVWLKREDLTRVFSFKIRGAYNCIAQLSNEAKARGVIAASAGNHAQGVAFAARELGLRCLIVMPKTTPAIKVNAVRAFGAEVEQVGDNYSEAAHYCRARVEETQMTYVAPFDDPEVIAGQGTVGVEILNQAPYDLGAIFVPIGGGGLAAGVAAYVKTLRPHVAVIGVEPDDSDAMARSLAENTRIVLPQVGIFADGVAVKQVGELTYRMCRNHLDAVVRVSVDEICAAIKDGFEDTRTLLEGAGALAIAGLKRYARERGLPPGPAVAIASGANISFNRLRYITERTDVGERREGLLAVKIPERRGAFREFCEIIGNRMVTEFNYRLASRESASIFVGLELAHAEELQEVREKLNVAGYESFDLTDDDVAKSHVRRMVGGRSALVENEVIYDFEFPERSGALADFLARLGVRWNISLFHYRNEGASFGRVLCGFEVPLAERASFHDEVSALGFRCNEVTDNRAARLFLS